MCLSGSAPALAQQTRHLDPEPNSIEHGYIEYVGNFGEVLTVPDSWNIRGAMHGAVEVVDISLNRQPFSIDEFTAKDSDFAAENFSRLHLIQLVIMPRAQSSFKTMEDLQVAKIADLDKAHAGYVVHDPPSFGGWAGSWPAGAFEVWVSTPYRLSQLYVGTTDFLCILTSGRDVPPAVVVGTAYDGVRSQLRDWLIPAASVDRAIVAEARLADDRGALLKNGLSFSSLHHPFVWGTWLAIVVLGGVLFMIAPKTGRTAVFGRIGRSLLTFPTAGAAVGTVFGYSVWTAPWASHRFPLVPAAAVLSLPLLLWPLRRRSPSISRSHSALTVWAMIVVSVLCWSASNSDWGSRWHRYVPFLSGVIAFISYGIGGVIWSVFSSDDEPRSSHTALIVLLLLSVTFGARDVFAQPVPIGKPTPNLINGDEEFEARSRLSARGMTVAGQRIEAIANLRAMGRILYKYQRVEITGIWSKDNTDHSIDGMFDYQAKPSQLSRQDGRYTDFLQALTSDLVDLSLEEMHGITYSALKTISDLKEKGKGVEVNEIVAHSWGTAIVYNAILTGAIKPPRRLVVGGMPDRDLEKWKALAKYTGTEVVVAVSRKLWKLS